MKFLIYSVSGEGAQIAKKIELEGNTVGLYIKDKLYRTVFDGLIGKVDTPDSFIDSDTVIIFDISGNGSIADSYKRKGHLVYGGSSFADDMEHDRKFGFQAMQKAGIKIPEYKEFQDFEAGRKYVQESNKRLVFKPSGSMPCKLTYCSKNSEELLSYLKFVEKQFGKHIDSFVLQEFIEGEVVSSEFFCDGEKFIWPPNHTVEVKKSMNDELGPSTGCSGNIVWSCEDDAIIQEGVAKIEEFCVRHQYIGQMDLNCVINESGAYGLEWTPRFGYDATPTLFYSFQDDLGKFFSDMVRQQAREIPCFEGYTGGVRLTIPPYPVEPKEGVDPEKFSPSLGVPILNIDSHIESCYLYEVEDDPDIGLCHSGGTGVILCAMGEGGTPKACLEEPYKILEDLVIPDKQYRTDLKTVLPKAVREVEKYA